MKKITPITMKKHTPMFYSPLNIRAERGPDKKAHGSKMAKSKPEKRQRRVKPPILSPSPQLAAATRNVTHSKRRHYGAQSTSERKLLRRSRKSREKSASADNAPADSPVAPKFEIGTSVAEDGRCSKRAKSPPSDIKSSIDFNETIGNIGNVDSDSDEREFASEDEDQGDQDGSKDSQDEQDDDDDEDSAPLQRQLFLSTKKQRRFILDDESSDESENKFDGKHESAKTKESIRSESGRTAKTGRSKMVPSASEANTNAPKTTASQISDSDDNNDSHACDSDQQTSNTKKTSSFAHSNKGMTTSLKRKQAIMIGKSVAANSPYVAKAYAKAAASLAIKNNQNKIRAQPKNALHSRKKKKKAKNESPEKAVDDFEFDEDKEQIEGPMEDSEDGGSDEVSEYYPTQCNDDLIFEQQTAPPPRRSSSRKKSNEAEHRASREQTNNTATEELKKIRPPRQIKDKSKETLPMDDSRKQRNDFTKVKDHQTSTKIKKIDSFCDSDDSTSGVGCKSSCKESQFHVEKDIWENDNNSFQTNDREPDLCEAKLKLGARELSNVFTQMEEPVGSCSFESDEDLEDEFETFKETEQCASQVKRRAKKSNPKETVVFDGKPLSPAKSIAPSNMPNESCRHKDLGGNVDLIHATIEGGNHHIVKHAREFVEFNTRNISTLLDPEMLLAAIQTQHFDSESSFESSSTSHSKARDEIASHLSGTDLGDQKYEREAKHSSGEPGENSRFAENVAEQIEELGNILDRARKILDALKCSVEKSTC